MASTSLADIANTQQISATSIGAQQQQQQYSARQQAAQQAAQLYQQGDIRGAYSALIAADPGFAEKIAPQLTDIDPGLAGQLTNSKVTGQETALNAAGNGPAQVAKIGADARVQAAEARANTAETALKYQLNPYTGAKEVYQGAQHLGTVGPDGNIVPATSAQADKQIVPETPADILNPAQQKQVTAASKDFAKQTKDVNEEVDGADRLKDLVAKNIPGTQLAQAMTFLTREEHVKRFNEAEFQKFGGDQNSILQRIQNATTQAGTGQLQPEQQQYLQGLADAVQKQALRSYTDQAEAAVNSLQQQGVPPNAALNRIIGGAPKSVRDYAQKYLSLQGDDKQAVDWARQNIQDPKAQQIMQMHGL